MLDFPKWKIWAVMLPILIGILLAIPSMMPASQAARLPDWMPDARINLGLDLAGGSHLLLEADLLDAAKQRLQSKEEEVTTDLRRGEPRIEIGDVSTAEGRAELHGARFGAGRCRGRADARAEPARRSERKPRLGRPASSTPTASN